MQELTIKQKLTNYYYFVIFNSILACIIGLGYWLHISINFCLSSSKLTDWLTVVYTISKTFFIVIIMVSIAGLMVLPTVYLSGKQRITIQTILSLVFLGTLYFDIQIFKSTFTHIIDINTIAIINTIINNKLILFTPNKIIAYIGILIFLGIIYRINIWINETTWFKNNNIGKKFIIVLVMITIMPQLIYLIANKDRKQQLLAYTQYLPLCANNDKIANKIHSTYKRIKTAKLQYPLHSLQTTAVINPPNILIIAMDAWRADCFNEHDSPNLWNFAKQGKIFNNHFSGGNHTSSGLFSLFYGVVSIYLNRFKQNKIPALLFSRLKQLDYQINCFTADDCIKYFINDTQNLYVTDNKKINLHSVDKQITDNWLNNYTNLDKTKPWFSFVFYDALHGPDFPEDYSTIAKPAIECDYKKFANKVSKKGFIKSYKTSVHYIDSLANQILTQLKKSNDLENTIVIITADHGCEWNDNNQGQWGYGSNFTDSQVKVPLAIILPKQLKEKLINQQDNLTTHYDIAPTLIYNFLGVTNDISDYSIGNDLLNKDTRTEKSWLLATKHVGYGLYKNAIIEKDKILTIYPSGVHNIKNTLNCLLFNKAINTKNLNEAIEYITRFIKK